MSGQLVRHQEYFFRDGDTTIRVCRSCTLTLGLNIPIPQVEDNMFRIHKHFLTRESRHFHSMLVPPAIPCRDPPGSSETNPIVLKDATSEGFAGLLWVFYNPCAFIQSLIRSTNKLIYVEGNTLSTTLP